MARFPLLLLMGEASEGKVNLNQFRKIYVETEDTKGKGDPPTEPQVSKRTLAFQAPDGAQVWQSPVLVPDLITGLCLKRQIQGVRETLMLSHWLCDECPEDQPIFKYF